MQRIFYRTVNMAWTGYDKDNWNTFTPHKERVDHLCAEFEQWANANGFRVTSVTPTTGSVVMGKSDSGNTAVTTAGVIFVCESIGAT